jgi:hypothetical protein
MLVCDLSEICLDGFAFTDVDDNITDIDITGGYQNGDQVCFVPVEGVNTITVVVTDACGSSDECVTEITVSLNSAPIVSCQHDTVIQVGQLDELCLDGFTYSDPDDNIETVTVSNGTIVGSTVCFTPVEGVNTITLTAEDECGLSDDCTSNITIVLNTCPEVVRPIGDTTTMCIYTDFCDTIEVVDADGDYIEMTTNYGELVPIIDEPGHWLGLYCFTIEDEDCGEHNSYQITINCDDGLCINDVLVVYEVSVLGYVDMYMDENVHVFPGMDGTVGLYLNTYDCLCVGSINASIAWDASMVTLLAANPTANLDLGSEFYYVNYDAFGPGTAKMTYIADLSDQVYHGPLCDIDPEDPIFNLEFHVAAGDYPSSFVIPICFLHENEMVDNAVSDSTGFYVWEGDGCSEPPDSALYGTLLLNMDCGSIIITDECDLLIGDVNLNGAPFDIGDAILLSNHLAYPADYPFSEPQLWVSDVNGDGIPASIADLIGIINVITGRTPLGKVTPPTVPAGVVVAYERDGSAVIRVQSDFEIGGLVLDMPVSDLQSHHIEYNQDIGMDVMITEADDHVRLLIYSNNGVSLSPGITEIMKIDNADRLKLEPSEIAVGDPWGNLAMSVVSHELPLPETFGISSCYPNPFNPITSVQFTTPTTEYVTLNIYDITGRLVKKLVDGYMTAGYHEVTWNGTNSANKQVSSGVYFAKLTSDSNNLNTSIEKLVLLK